MSNFLTSNKLTSSSSNTQSTATASTSGRSSQASTSSTSISATRSSSVSVNDVASTSTSDNSIPTYIVGKETLNAEVKWCIRTVVKHQSYKSNADIRDLGLISETCFQIGRTKNRLVWQAWVSN